VNAIVLYDSQYGNTERIAQAIADALGQYGQARAVRVAETNPGELAEVDLLVVGCPTQGWRPTTAILSFLEHIQDGSWSGLAAAAFDTRFRGPRLLTGSAARRIAQSLQKKGCSLLLPAESFFIKGTEGPLQDGEIERAAAWARLVRQKYESMPGKGSA
jgi:flavodoxin